MGDIKVSTKLLVLFEEISNFLDTLNDEELIDFQVELQKNNHLKKQINKIFPNMTSEEILNFLTIIKLDRDTSRSKANQVEFVGTIPSDVKTDLRQTISVVRQVILEAEKSILITGYSISDFINEILDLLLMKSHQGVKIHFFIDKGVDIENIKQLKNENFRIFKYRSNRNFSSLHAKVIVIDDRKAFISSSNLSYNGIVNNIEIGTLVIGEKVTRIKDLFENLLKKDLFFELR